MVAAPATTPRGAGRVPGRTHRLVLASALFPFVAALRRPPTAGSMLSCPLRLRPPQHRALFGSRARRRGLALREASPARPRTLLATGPAPATVMVSRYAITVMAPQFLQVDAPTRCLRGRAHSFRDLERVRFARLPGLRRAPRLGGGALDIAPGCAASASGRRAASLSGPGASGLPGHWERPRCGRRRSPSCFHRSSPPRASRRCRRRSLSWVFSAFRHCSGFGAPGRLVWRPGRAGARPLPPGPRPHRTVRAHTHTHTLGDLRRALGLAVVPPRLSLS